MPTISWNKSFSAFSEEEQRQLRLDESNGDGMEGVGEKWLNSLLQTRKRVSGGCDSCVAH